MARDEEVAVEAINLFTPREQLIRLAAELDELGVETHRLIRGDNNIRDFASEFADVKFTLLQALIILQHITNGTFESTLEVEYNYKVERTKALIDAEKKKKELQQSAQQKEAEVTEEDCAKLPETQVN